MREVWSALLTRLLNWFLKRRTARDLVLARELGSLGYALPRDHSVLFRPSAKPLGRLRMISYPSGQV